MRLGRLPLRVLDDPQPWLIDRPRHRRTRPARPTRDLGGLGLVFEP
jgi:hypothetical protein